MSDENISDNISLLEERNVNELSEMNFFIPSYQRGYRWTKHQIKDLLNDIDSFVPIPVENTDRKTWYCLQPIVVKECSTETKKKNDLKGTWYEVIDGQQRLTSIFLIIHYANEMWVGKQKYPEFELCYETRSDSTDFLNNLEVDEKTNSVIIDNSDIDLAHISRAYNFINDWVNVYKQKNNKKLDDNYFQSKLKSNTKVIWYELRDNSDSIDIFTRLNIGKIPLTNAELIKALFLGNLKSDNTNQTASYKQLQIASEWDSIENSLQDNAFWHFIYDKDNKTMPKELYETRIEFIFDLMKGKKGGEEKYFTFYKFLLEDFKTNKTIYGKPDIEAIWNDIKKYFLTFIEWYQTRELYHKVGFLIATGSNIIEIKEKSNSLTKSAFKNYLNETISNEVNFDIESLDYQNNKDKVKIRKILLLFNIITLLDNKKSKSLFPFDNYKKGNWDIEHVRSQSEVELNGKERIDWAKLVLEYYSGQKVTETNVKEQIKLISELDDEDEKQIGLALIKFIKSENTDEDFNTLYDKVSKAFKEDNPPNSDEISNLCLLDSGTNRAYKNAFFPLKRMIIINRQMTGTFIPICTKNVFMKAYSKRFKKVMYWDKSDASDYLQAINETLKIYLP